MSALADIKNESAIVERRRVRPETKSDSHNVKQRQPIGLKPLLYGGPLYLVPPAELEQSPTRDVFMGLPFVNRSLVLSAVIACGIIY